MFSFSAFKDDYERTWVSFRIRQGQLEGARKQAEAILAGKLRYQEVESRTNVPWWFIGLVHYRESALDFDTYLGNGQSLSRRTTIVPKGRGPFTGFNPFLSGAIDALRIEGFVGAVDWSIGRTLFRLEGFNGYGYHGKGVNSPYLWGGSTAYGPPESRGGKYIRDGVFDAIVVDPQLGTAVILKALIELDGGIVFDSVQPPKSDLLREPDDELVENTVWVQQALNLLGTLPALAEDGRNGPKTMSAVSSFQQEHGIEDSGLIDAPTIAAIQRDLQAREIGSSSTTLSARVSELERKIPTASPTPEIIRLPATAPMLPTTEFAASLDTLTTALKQAVSAILQSQASNGMQPNGSIQKAFDLLRAASPPTKFETLGQVNGALGSTLGEMLNGKKTAIGLIGSVATQILSQVPSSTGLGQVLTLITPAAGLSPYTLPIFLGITLWGVLGKLEKWQQNTALIPSNLATSKSP